VAIAIDQLKNFGISMIIIIGLVAFGIAFLVLIWNKRLETIASTRTEQLMKTNSLLTDSNKQLEIANEQLKNQDNIQKEFINIAAHELRTPIQPIIGLTDVLRSTIKDKDQTEYLNIISRNAKRLSGLSQDILDAAMIESGSLKLTKEQVDLNDLLLHLIKDEREQILRSANGTIKLLYNKSQVNNDGLEGEQQPRQNQILVQVDKMRISQVISNLLRNAIKFSQVNKDGTIFVTLEKRRKKGNDNIADAEKQEEAIVTLKDIGSGIDSDIMPRLFTKFATKSHQGTGLGLYISKNIIEAHGGRIWAENNADGKGATFYFSIPLSK
jgi:signal transduction histidine kinase